MRPGRRLGCTNKKVLHLADRTRVALETVRMADAVKPWTAKTHGRYAPHHA